MSRGVACVLRKSFQFAISPLVDCAKIFAKDIFPAQKRDSFKAGTGKLFSPRLPPPTFSSPPSLSPIKAYRHRGKRKKRKKMLSLVFGFAKSATRVSPLYVNTHTDFQALFATSEENLRKLCKNDSRMQCSPFLKRKKNVESSSSCRYQAGWKRH